MIQGRDDRFTARPAVLFGSVASIAAALRFSYFLTARAGDLFPGLFLDSRYYANLAAGIVRGDLATDSPYLLSPLYPYFLSLFTGVDGELAVWGVRALQMALGVLTAVIAASLARRAAGVRAGWIAGILCGIFGPLIHYEALVLAESLQGFCLITAFWLVTVAMDKSAPGGRTMATALAAGILLGIGSALRPTALVLVLATVVAIITVARRENAPLKPALATALALLTGAAIAIAPFTLHNASVPGETVLLSANGGFNFWIGNNSSANGTFNPPRGYDFEHDPVAVDIARKEAGRPLSYAEASSWWTSSALEDIRERPLEWAALIVKKVGLAIAPAEIPQMGEDFTWYRDRAWPLRMPVSATMILVIGLLAPVSLHYLGRKGSPAISIASLWMIAYLMTIALFFVTGRYRAPIMPLACLLAGVTAASIAEHLGHTRTRTKAAVLAGSAIAGILAISLAIGPSTTPSTPGSPTGIIERQNGLLMYEQGKYGEAEAWYRKSLAIREDPITRGNLANALKAQGNIDGAEAEYRRALAMDPKAAVSWYNLGNLYRDHRKDRKAATECYERAIDCQPRFSNPYLTLALLYSYDGNYRRALEVIDRGLERIPSTEGGIRARLVDLRDQFSRPGVPR